MILQLLTGAVREAMNPRRSYFAEERDDFLSLRYYIDACFDAQCEEAILPIVERFTAIDKLSPTKAQQRASEDIVPLAAYGVQRNGGKAFPGLRQLQDIGISLYLDWLASRDVLSTRTHAVTSRLAEDEISTLMKATVVDGSPDLLMSM